MFRTKAVEKIDTCIFCFATVFGKSCRLRDSGEKYWTVGQATDVNMARAHCIPKTTHTHTHTHARARARTHAHTHSLSLSLSLSLMQCNTFWFFHHNKGCMNAPQCYVIHSLPCVSIILPSTWKSSKWFLPLRFPHGNSIYICAVRHACHMPHPFLRDLITRIVFGEECRSWSASLCSLPRPS